MSRGLRVGDQFYGNFGSIVEITAVKGRKIKFQVFGGVPMYGSMRLREFLHQYKGKQAA
jgi:hypothetical protein